MPSPQQPEPKPAQPEPTGSTTNASDAVDDIELPPDASPCEVVDAGVEETFPASDPVAVQDAYETANEREKRARGGGGQAEQPEAPRPRSPDWLMDKHEKR
jgi:hypothetical protein